MAGAVTRFAPSPTGPLHLGHAFAAFVAHDLAAASGGTFRLRIEDIDQGRARPHWEAAIHDDLAWLGLGWTPPAMRQSERLEAYEAAVATLASAGLVYPCRCRRRDILAALSAPQEEPPPAAVPTGPDGPVYPGTCRPAPGATGGRPPWPKGVALRLDMARALGALDAAGASPALAYRETGEDPGWRRLDPRALIGGIGDAVLARPGMGTAYHLAVVVDDAAQGITHVTRGADLAPATALHVVLQRLLDLPVPVCHHHRLIRDGAGRRLAKRDDARALAKYRAEGLGPDDIRRLVGLPPQASGVISSTSRPSSTAV